ncbi:MAG: AAA family ATPase [Bdellovibrionales bacterium CG10_big_fil_rev_8_21_14_0_10_45_34]|nr:MAG: AAA family ATPase [Bdellovibrionales bacterium CG10_big_fil_rev_8_21_14_0_10_45_34]
MHIQRYLREPVLSDLKKKMVFLGGPRQVGKTTFAQNLAKNYGYLNWDEATHREKILKGQLPTSKLLVLDELHKYRQWRNWIKGKFDTLKDKHEFLVTGSARLDLYRFSGDSLQGRYFYYRMHPLSVKELEITTKSDFSSLLQFSGFPEPFFAQSEKEYRRWSRDYRTRFFRDDLTPIETVSDIGSLELLMLRLPQLVGSPLSINSIREDLQKSHKTVSRWLDIFERLYGIFRLSPFGASRIRAVKKEQKHYHFDWALCEEPGKKLENLVACHLLKAVHFLTDSEGIDGELRYFRDSDGREVDFVMIENSKPKYFVEVKNSAKEVSSHLIYLKRKFPGAQAFQVHTDPRSDYINADGIRVCPAWKFLADLPV